MFISRLSFTLASAAIITVALLWFMSNSILQQQMPVNTSPTIIGFDFFRTNKEEDTVKPIDRMPKPATPLVPPSTPPIERRTFTVTHGKGRISHFPPMVKPTSGDQASSPGLMPLMKISPEYPSRASTAGIEGYVIVEYTVNHLGMVVNPKVIDSFPMGYFERAVLRAITRFRYNPHTVNGKAQDMHGMQQKFTFELDKQQG